jgi:hypothetical protein
VDGGPGRLVLRLARGSLAALDVAAMLTIVLTPGIDLVNFFSYFTIQSNVIAVVVLAGGALADPGGPRWAYLRGAATLYIVITGLVYNTLLINVSVGVASPWVNDVVHRIVPALMLLDWILFSPWARTHVAAALGWLAYPLAYVAYTLLRGPHVDWYPYPFLDPRLDGGYGRVALYTVVLALVFALLAVVVNAIGRWRHTASRAGAFSPGS